MTDKTLDERVKELEKMVHEQSKTIESLMIGRKSWFEPLRNEIEERDIIPRTDVLEKYTQIDNRHNERIFLSTYLEIKRLRIPYKGGKILYVYVGKTGNHHPAKLLINNWHILVERKGLPFDVIEKKERCPEEQIVQLKRWCKTHLSKWLLINNEGIYKK